MKKIEKKIPQKLLQLIISSLFAINIRCLILFFLKKLFFVFFLKKIFFRKDLSVSNSAECKRIVNRTESAHIKGDKLPFFLPNAYKTPGKSPKKQNETMKSLKKSNDKINNLENNFSSISTGKFNS